jgi:hypothetical protein
VVIEKGNTFFHCRDIKTTHTKYRYNLCGFLDIMHTVYLKKTKIILFLEILKYYISQFGIDFQEFIPKIGFPPFKSP